MLCPNCGSQSSRLKTRIVEGEPQTRCHICGDFSELSHFRGPLVSPKTKQRLEWQRESFASDLEQPYELQKGEKGWKPNKRYIKTYKGDPAKMGMYSQDELKGSGVVSKKEATAIKQHTRRDSPK